jgi:hypothetical protein
MLGSAVVYSGIVAALVGLLAAIKPFRLLRLSTRRRGFLVAAAGIALAIVGMLLPAPVSRINGRATRLDDFMPAWQFRELHTIEIDAPPETAFNALKQVRADEILFFRTLTWIRRAGRPLPPSILNAGSRESLIDVALNGGFVRLAEEAPRELVIGTVVVAPRGTRGSLTPDVFQKPLPPGFAIAAMNFLVTANGPGRSLVSTETRVFANSTLARRQFARYWRLIYPGSAIIRRMWLRAVRIRASRPERRSDVR